jgi:hypothetical protein
LGFGNIRDCLDVNTRKGDTAAIANAQAWRKAVRPLLTINCNCGGSGGRKSLLLNRRARRDISRTELLQHLLNDGFKSGQVNCRDFPELPVIKALVLVPQDVPDADDGLPWPVIMTVQKIRRQRPRRFRYYLCSALDSAAVNVTSLMLLEGYPFESSSYALDFITDVK